MPQILHRHYNVFVLKGICTIACDYCAYYFSTLYSLNRQQSHPNVCKMPHIVNVISTVVSNSSDFLCVTVLLEVLCQEFTSIGISCSTLFEQLLQVVISDMVLFH